MGIEQINLRLRLFCIIMIGLKQKVAFSLNVNNSRTAGDCNVICLVFLAYKLPRYLSNYAIKYVK